MDRELLGKMLVQGNFIIESEIERFINESIENNQSIISLVVKHKKVEYSSIATFISQRFLSPYIDLDEFDIESIIPEIDYKLIEKNKFLPIKKINNSLVIIVSELPSQTINEELQFATGAKNITCIIAEENKLLSTIEKYLQIKGVNFNKDLEGDELLDMVFIEDEEDGVKNNIEPDKEDGPIVKFVNSVLLEAIKLKVSDLHFEPYEKSYRVRFRLDGQLYEARKSVPVSIKEKIASRIKVISKLDISEKRVPQDGRFKLYLPNKTSMDFRVSTLPTIWGEKIVMRILDSSSDNLDIDKLGYDEIQKQKLLEAVARPYGMVLVTGPTGSGKTVSLYTCLSILNKENVNICTAEDPVEINLLGVNQVNMNEKAGLNFQVTLKAFLRQDPDTILIGEIRDYETAEIAIKAAQTGHMVLSTLHTNDAPKTITRLLNMGVAPFNITSSVILITAQRLARRLCQCKEKENVPVNVLLESGLDPSLLEDYGTKWHAYKPVGCEICGGKGYKGRVGIYQVMPMLEEIKKAILDGATDIGIAEIARNNGIYSLREAGLLKVKEGITSLEEILGCTNID